VTSATSAVHNPKPSLIENPCTRIDTGSGGRPGRQDIARSTDTSARAPTLDQRVMG